MTTKKATRRAAKGNTIQDRARAIIGDTSRYDKETREAVAYALENDPPNDLAETVRTAERGDLIADTRICSAKACRAARKVAAFVNSGDVPDYLTNVVHVALNVAAKKHGIEPHPGENFDLRALADLLTISRGERSYIAPTQSLAELLSAVLTHPDLPDDLIESIGEAMNEMFTRLDGPVQRAVEYHPEYIGRLLSAYAEKGGA